MAKYKFSIRTCYVGSEVEEIVELYDDLDDEAVQEAWQDWVWENIYGGYEKVEE